MFCGQCGQDNPEQAVSCFRCGKPLGVESPARPAEASATGAALGVAPAQERSLIMPPVEAQTDGKAVASLVFGILGVLTTVFLIGILLGLPAVILGHVSRSAIQKSMGKLKGAGMALAGLIMGYISLSGILVFPIILIVAAIAIPNLLASRITANETSAAASVRTIVTASSTYRVDNAVYPVDLENLQKAGLIDSALATGRKSGYRFTYTSSGDHLFVLAVPEQPGTSGTRTFCSGEDQILRAAKGQECTLDSPPLTANK